MHEGNLSRTKEADHFSDTLSPTTSMRSAASAVPFITDQENTVGSGPGEDWGTPRTPGIHWMGPKKSHDLDALACSLVLEASSALPSGHVQSHFFSQMHFGTCKLSLLLEVIT